MRLLKLIIRKHKLVGINENNYDPISYNYINKESL